MAANGKKENLLTSWKEIAAYLDRDVRTCIRWEQRYGLPVHRLDRESKAKVFAYKDEVDGWLRDRSATSPLEPRRSWAGPAIGRFLMALALIAVAAAAYFLVPGLRSDRVPADFHIYGPMLVVTNARGAELWRRDTGIANLETEDLYRKHFQVRKHDGEFGPQAWPLISFVDLDGDGRRETLFSIKTTDETNEGTLTCYNPQGREMWRFRAGRELVFGGKLFRREYRIFGFDVADYDGDGKPEVLVMSVHKPDWPCQVAILDARGNLKGEYWNSGYLLDAATGDIDGDGQKELVLSGVNNGFRRGCVVVFKAGNVHGSSPQDEGDFRCSSLGPGTQIAYILFPGNRLHELTAHEGEPINSFWIHEGAGMTGVTQETGIFFDLDRRLDCTSVTFGNFTRNLYERLVRGGAVLPPLDKHYEKALASGFLYYEGGAWVRRPAPFPAAAAGGASHGAFPGNRPYR